MDSKLSWVAILTHRFHDPARQHSPPASVTDFSRAVSLPSFFSISIFYSAWSLPVLFIFLFFGLILARFLASTEDERLKRRRKTFSTSSCPNYRDSRPLVSWTWTVSTSFARKAFSTWTNRIAFWKPVAEPVFAWTFTPMNWRHSAVLRFILLPNLHEQKPLFLVLSSCSLKLDCGRGSSIHWKNIDCSLEHGERSRSIVRRRWRPWITCSVLILR